jgi:hypothetical protein
MVSNFSPSTDRPAAVAVVLPANQFGNSGRGRCENAAALPIAGTLDSLTHLVFVSATGRIACVTSPCPRRAIVVL